MSKKNPETLSPSEFKALQSKWYAKLKAKGFVDIEREEGDSIVDDTRFSMRFRFRKTKEQYESDEEYYRACRSFLHDCKFKNKLEREIWRLHSEGISYREIAKELRCGSRFVTFKCVKKYKALMLQGLYGDFTTRNRKHKNRARNRRASNKRGRFDRGHGTKNTRRVDEDGALSPTISDRGTNSNSKKKKAKWRGYKNAKRVYQNASCSSEEGIEIGG